MDNTYAQFDLGVHGRVLMVTVYGSVDLDSMQVAFAKIEALISQLKKPWATLVDLRQWDLYTEEMVEPLAQFQAWLIENGHELEVSISGGSELKKQARDRLWSHLTVAPDHVYVDTPEQGWNLLIEKGYCEERPYEKG